MEKHHVNSYIILYHGTKWAIGPSGYANNVGHYQRVPGTVISQRLMTPEDADSPYNLIIPPLLMLPSGKHE